MSSADKEDFKQTVFQIVRLIPKGRISNYGAIAKAAGYPNLSRMVGKILSNSSEEQIPAHRVVNSQGILSGRFAFGDYNTMQQQLEKEGINVKNNKIADWTNVFWNPLVELNP